MCASVSLRLSSSTQNGIEPLCVTPAKDYYLLDINPFGKYLWIEYAIGAPITDAIARFLIGKSMHPQLCI